MTVTRFNNTMVPETADEYPTPLRPGEYQQLVDFVLDTLATQPKEKRNGVLDGVLARDPRIRAAFFAAFECGYALEPMVLKEVAARTWSRDLPEAWTRESVFNDDKNFIPERFYLGVHHKLFTSISWGWAAIAQARRMLEKGMIDPAYFVGLRLTTPETEQFFDLELMAYTDKGAKSYTDIVHMAYSRFRSISPGVQQQVDMMQQKIAWVDAEKERLFTSVWLPAMLPPEEWAGIKDSHPDLLRTLYATQWEAGYDGYRAFMISA